MGFVAVTKTKAYYKRYQTKFRRRRENKTDYYQRQRLIIQDKNKYNSPKHRLVVRVTNRDISAQVVSADLTHDVVVCAAYSHELRRYGIKVGYGNYAAAYCTGLLLARRINAKFGLNYEGVVEANGEDFIVETDGDKAPFKALMDVGLKRTTTGSKIFGVLKGAVDGGLQVPHNHNRFPGSKADAETGKFEYDAEFHRKYIFGGHVKEYMESLQDNQEVYKQRFGRYVANGVGPDDIEDMYKKAHEAIRADPNKARDPLELGAFKTRAKPVDPKKAFVKKSYKKVKLSVQERKARIKTKLTAKGVESIGPVAYESRKPWNWDS